MPAVVSMFRGLNVGRNHRIRMDALNGLHTSLGLESCRTYIQSGNVLFYVREADLPRLAARIEQSFERSFGFQSHAILRTSAQLRSVIDRNPFRNRPELDPRKLTVTFLARDPGAEARARVAAWNAAPDELRLDGSELYIYFPDGMGRSKLASGALDKALATPGTNRNWNTVNRLLEMAEELELALN